MTGRAATHTACLSIRLAAEAIALTATLQLPKGLKHSAPFDAVIQCIYEYCSTSLHAFWDPTGCEAASVPFGGGHRAASTFISSFPALSWELLCFKSKPSSLSHHTAALTDAKRLEDSFLTVSEQPVSAWVGFTASVLQVKQAPLQPLTMRCYCLPASFCFGQVEDKNEENKMCPCNRSRGRKAREKLAFLFLLLPSPSSPPPSSHSLFCSSWQSFCTGKADLPPHQHDI